MRKILMRSGVDPMVDMAPGQAITQDVMNGNIGNMLFAYGIERVLYTDDTQIDVVRTSHNFTKDEIEQINSEYDCFVIPLANAFRPKFEDELDAMARTIKRLKIPTIVIGVGMQAKIGEDIRQAFPFDKSSANFVKTVLEHSSMIGIRGEITAEYLKKLGFQEEKDFTVIGCPSMFMYGKELNMKLPGELTPKTRVSVNRKINIPAKLHQFIFDSQQLFEDAYFVPQGIDDLLLLYAGKPIDRKVFPKIHQTYPWRMDHEICAQGRELGFTNVPSWLSYLKEREFSFGSRIHGNIAATLAGIPAFILAPDSRVLELAEYHNIQHMLAKDINENTNIFDLYEKADFSMVEKGHEERFHHYIDFLEANGLEHVFGKERQNRRTKFDQMIEEQTFSPAVTSLHLQSVEEQSDRLQLYYEYIQKSYGSVKNLERYAKVEKMVTSMLDIAPKGLTRTIKKGIKRVVD